MGKMTYIYALRCPLTGDIRYVGKSNNPELRLQKHMSPATNWRKIQWVREVKAEGKRLELVILERVPASNYRKVEDIWIKFFLEAGCPLVNRIYKGYSNKQMRRDYNKRSRRRWSI